MNKKNPVPEAGSRGPFKPTPREPTSGFTLIEVIVAIIILTIGILAVAQMTVLGMRTSQVLKARGESKEVLAKGLEVLKAMATTDPLLAPTCDSTTLDDTTLAYLALPGNAVGRAIGPTTYTVWWNVAGDFPIANHLTIRMMVFNSRKQLATADFVKWR